MKVTSPTIVWQAELENATVRAVLKPGQELVFERQTEDAAGDSRWTALNEDTETVKHITIGRLREASKLRFMLDYIGDLHEKRKEIQDLTKQRDELRKHETDEQREAREKDNHLLGHLPPRG